MKQKTKFKKTEVGKIPEYWEEKLLCEFVTFQRGHDLPVSQMNEGKYPVIGSNGKIGQHNKFKAKGPGVTIGRSGNLGTPFFIECDYWPHNTVLYVKDFHGSDAKFVYYFLKRLKLDRFNAGSAVPTLNRNHIHTLPIIAPNDVNEQSAIAKIFLDLDSKIELNQQMNKNLEEIGKAIFKKWFVDFEFPNEKGKPYKSSGGKMVDSELGKAPKGWKTGKLGDHGTFKNGINYLRGEVGDTEFFITNVRDIANNRLLLKESLGKIKIDFKKAKEYLLRDKDILIARSASPGETSLVLGDLENVIYSGFSIRYRLKNPNNFLYFFLILQGLKENLLNFSIGTTLQSVNQETLKNMKFILPPDEILKEFNKIIELTLDKTYNCLIQNRDLSQIRDTLLPKLMSGKIRVPVGGKS